MTIKCKWCGDTGKHKRRGSYPAQRYQCRKCGRYFQVSNAPIPEIYVIDIETLPIVATAWSLWNPVGGPKHILQDWCLLSFSCKKLYEAKCETLVLTPQEAIERNDRRLALRLHEIFNKGQIFIAHNGKSFDFPRIRSRFLLNKLPPTSSYQIIDTKIAAAKAFGFSSNKLDYLAKLLGYEPKMDTDIELWHQCMKGDKQALKYMAEYNEYDTILLEDVYTDLRPWVPNHPNLSLYMSMDKSIQTCPNCNSDNISFGDYYRTTASVFDEFGCNNCGARGRVKKSSRTSGVRAL